MWKLDKKEGFGKRKLMIENKMRQIYEGYWKNGFEQGQGRKGYPNGDIYIGEFKEGYKNGNGNMK